MSDFQDLAYYRSLPYSRVWETRTSAQERYFLVRLAEVPFVAGDGLTREEALSNLRSAFDDFLSSRLESGLPVPSPQRPIPTSTPSTLSVDWNPALASMPPIPHVIDSSRDEGAVKTVAPVPTYQQSVPLEDLCLAS